MHLRAASLCAGIAGAAQSRSLADSAASTMALRSGIAMRGKSSCTRRARFQGRMIQLARVVLSHARMESFTTHPIKKHARLFMNCSIGLRFAVLLRK
jgi:hypothetical protein